MRSRLAGDRRQPTHRRAVVGDHPQLQRALARRLSVEQHFAEDRIPPEHHEEHQQIDAAAGLADQTDRQRGHQQDAPADRGVDQPGDRARHRARRRQAQGHAFGRVDIADGVERGRANGHRVAVPTVRRSAFDVWHAQPLSGRVDVAPLLSRILCAPDPVVCGRCRRLLYLDARRFPTAPRRIIPMAAARPEPPMDCRPGCGACCIGAVDRAR